MSDTKNLIRKSPHEITPRRFRMAMASANLTMRDVGEVCGVSAQAVCKWMNGHCLPSSSKLVLFSKATGASLDWLMSPDDPFGPPFESMRAEYRAIIEAQEAEIAKIVRLKKVIEVYRKAQADQPHIE